MLMLAGSWSLQEQKKKAMSSYISLCPFVSLDTAFVVSHQNYLETADGP